jgi:phosphoglucomutase
VAGQISPLAGKTVEPSMLLNVPRLVTAYFTGEQDPTVPSQRIAFGTSGHRGSAFDNAFNEAHILAISEALCRYRSRNRITGPLFVGIDTHALSEPALASALEVFADNGVSTMIDERHGYTPTPVISHSILTYNKNRKKRSRRRRHHPRTAGSSTTHRMVGQPITQLRHGSSAPQTRFWKKISRPCDESHTTARANLLASAVTTTSAPMSPTLANVVDMEAIRSAGVRSVSIRWAGRASIFWHAIIERYGIAGTIVNDDDRSNLSDSCLSIGMAKFEWIARPAMPWRVWSTCTTNSTLV